MNQIDFAYINFPSSFYHGMIVRVLHKGSRVTKIKVKLDSKWSYITFYNHQISKVNPLAY